jgi:hypothetical protein
MNLVSQMTIPKYGRNMKVPWISSHEIRVLRESDVPPPTRPAKVRVGGVGRFLQPVDAAQIMRGISSERRIMSIPQQN